MMEIRTSTAKKVSKAVSLACAILVAVYAIKSCPPTSGLWEGALAVVGQAAGLLPWWAVAGYGVVAAIGLLASVISGKLKWGVALRSNSRDKVTLLGILLWAMFIPTEIIMLFIAWPFMLARMTVFRTRPDRG